VCGIAGIVSLTGSNVDRDTLQAMVDVLKHRGPDNTAISGDGAIGLGHTRLSIIDVSHDADQPFRSADGRYVIVYNGEIYNYLELRRKLIDKGIEFHTTSDTEVLLNAYLRWGRDCLVRMNGMFAFVIYDSETQNIFGARDRFGIKPFHYCVIDDHLIFASEIKALLQAVPKHLPIDTRKTVELLLYRELIDSNLFSDVETLRPGHYIDVALGDQAQVKIERWFHVSDLPNPDYSNRLAGLTREQRLNELDRVLNEAVARHLISDVPVGSLCSGGVDSSLMTAMACRSRPDVTVYHVDVEGASERAWAEKVARHLDVELNCFVLNKQQYLANYIECVYYNDYPLTHPQNGPIFYVSDLARKNGCKVLLAGEGADETFGGYDWRYRLRCNYRRFERLTWLLRKIHRKILFMATGVWMKDFDRELSFKAWAHPRDIVGFLGDELYRRQLEEECRRAYSFVKSPVEREVQAAMVADLRDYVGGILHQQDRASMQASIESRVPFLDIEVARFAANLSLADKISRRESKRILKNLALRYLPRDLVLRTKVGFAGPTSKHLMSLGTNIFENGFLARELHLSVGTIRTLLEQRPGSFAHMLYGLEFWGRMFVWGDSPEELQSRVF
jgi:asparagine synthase (glutamine-hydrolysing)